MIVEDQIIAPRDFSGTSNSSDDIFLSASRGVLVGTFMRSFAKSLDDDAVRVHPELHAGNGSHVYS